MPATARELLIDHPSIYIPHRLLSHIIMGCSDYWYPTAGPLPLFIQSRKPICRNAALPKPSRPPEPSILPYPTDGMCLLDGPRMSWLLGAGY